MPLFGSPDVRKLKEKRDLPGLLQALEYQPRAQSGRAPEVRRDAARALAEIGDERAIRPLIAAGGRAIYNSEEQQAVAQALLSFGGRVVEPLCEQLGLDQDWFMAKPGQDSAIAFAVNLLGQLQDKRAVEPLIRLFLQNPVLREETAAALAILGDSRAVSTLVKALEKGQIPPPDLADNGRAAVFRALGELQDEQAIEPLVAAFWRDLHLRTPILEALARFDDPRALQPLVDSLLSHDAERRRLAAEALQTIPSAQAVRPLVQAVTALRDPGLSVRLQAIETLGGLPSTLAISPLIQVLCFENPDERWRAADALASRGAAAVPNLVTALGDSGKRTGVNAAIALWQIGAPALEPLVAALQRARAGDWLCRRAASVLQLWAEDETRAGKAEGPVLNALRSLSAHPDANVRNMVTAVSAR